MRSSWKLKVGTAFLLGVVWAGALAAQQPGTPEKKPMQRHVRVERLERRLGPGHLPGGPPGPGMLLQHREALGLSADQVSKLEALAAGDRKAAQQQVPARMRAHADLVEATAGEINLETARAALDRLARLQADGHFAHLRSLKEARQLLTPEQRSKVDAMAGPMGHHRMMHGPRIMMMRRGGMRGGMMRGPLGFSLEDEFEGLADEFEGLAEDIVDDVVGPGFIFWTDEPEEPPPPAR